jgi:hypothetical protein
MAYLDEDPVRNYAFAVWLKESAHPIFKTLAEAEKFAEEREWPRKKR